MNVRTPLRSEERHRRDAEGRAWADTVPACFRSEAFAEDLFELPAPQPTPPPRRLGTSRNPAPAVTAQSAS